MTLKQKHKAVLVLHAAEAANEQASLALMNCKLETPEIWLRQFGAPMHVALERQLHTTQSIREWLERQDVEDPI